MDKDLHRTAADAARIMNYKKHAEQLSVPVLKGFERKDDGNPQTILLAEGWRKKDYQAAYRIFL